MESDGVSLFKISANSPRLEILTLNQVTNNQIKKDKRIPY